MGGGGKGGSAPSAPNYEKLADKQAQAQLDLLNKQTQANRPNQYTPWGSVTWSNDRQFNQEAYDAAMAAYNQGLAGGAGGRGEPIGYTTVYDGSGNDQDSGRSVPVYADGSIGGRGSGGSAGGVAIPNRDDFYTGGDQWSQTVTLSPEQQALFDQYNKLQQGMFGSQDAALGRVQDMYANGFNPTTPQIYDPNLATNNATELLMQRLNPQLDQQYDQLQARLANQGITMGSEAWRNANTQFDQGRNDAYNQASLAGIGLGMQQQGMMNQQQQQAFHNEAYLRQLPLQELQALMGGTQVSMPQTPGFAQSGLGQATDYVGAANMNYNAALNQYNASQANQSGLMGGIGSLVGAGIGGVFGGMPGAGLGSQVGGGIGGLFSDRRLKTDIKLVGVADNGLNIYSYRYITGGPHQIGHMAEEVEKAFPDAVTVDPSGFKVVHYEKVY